MKLHVRRGDHVVVLSGRDKGKKGKILKVNPDDGKLIIEGVHMASKHKKPRSARDLGGIIKQETPIYACKVMLICNKCGEPARTGRKVLGNGDSVRFCKKCGEFINE